MTNGTWMKSNLPQLSSKVQLSCNKRGKTLLEAVSKRTIVQWIHFFQSWEILFSTWRNPNQKDEINFFLNTQFRSCILFCWKVHSSLQLALAVNLQIFVQKLDKKWWWLPPLKVEMSLINAFFSLPAWTVIAPPLTFLSKCNCVLIQQIHANFFLLFLALAFYK